MRALKRLAVEFVACSFPLARTTACVMYYFVHSVRILSGLFPLQILQIHYLSSIIYYVYNTRSVLPKTGGAASA